MRVGAKEHQAGVGAIMESYVWFVCIWHQHVSAVYFRRDAHQATREQVSKYMREGREGRH